MPKRRRIKTNKLKKGSKYVCASCGLIVTVNKSCGCVATRHLICCGRTMKLKKKRSK